MNELNGIAFQGVGSGTNVDFIQVHNNADDGVEFFGGAVNAKHVVLTGIRDDNIDWVAGWQGKMQFALVQQASDAGDQGIEADNNENGQDLTPRSNPTISNVTLIGDPARDTGILLREGTAARIANSIVTGFDDPSEGCLDIDDDATFAQVTGGELVLESLFFSCVSPFKDDASDVAALSDIFAGTVGAGSGNETGSSTLSGVFPGASELAVTPVDLNASDSFFDAVDYIGAFGPTETAENSWASGWTLGVFPAPECPEGTTEDATDALATADTRVCSLSGTIESDLELTRGNLYRLDGAVFVGRDTGADDLSGSGLSVDLTIQSGVTLFGASGSDFLVVNRGSNIFANGTASAPIVMTSRSDLAGAATATTRGEWGGLIINGQAPINNCPLGADPCETTGEGGTGTYGGAIPTDSSGRLNYVRVQYAGFEITPMNELNGIAFQGVGSGTEVDFIQVHNNADDGVEFFGGTVNAKHLVLTGIRDDNIDWVAGWQGNLQFAIVAQASDAGDQGIEADNNENGQDLTPRSNPTIANVTLIGDPARDTGILLREGTSATIINSIVTGFDDPSEGCLDIDDDATFAQVTGGSLVLESLYFSCVDPFKDDASDVAALADIFAGTVGAGSNNSTGTSTLVGVVPGANENITPVRNASTLDPFFDSADYIGAVEDADDDWFEGWTIALP